MVFPFGAGLFLTATASFVVGIVNTIPPPLSLSRSKIVTAKFLLLIRWSASLLIKLQPLFQLAYFLFELHHLELAAHRGLVKSLKIVHLLFELRLHFPALG